MRHIIAVPAVTTVALLAMVLVAASATAQEAKAGGTAAIAPAFVEPPPCAPIVPDGNVFSRISPPSAALAVLRG